MMEAPVHYAGFWRRVAASLLDTLIFAVVLAPFIYLFTSGDYFYTSEVEAPLELLQQVDWGYLLLEEGVPFVVVIFFWLRFEATPGKRLLNCYVVDSESFKALSLKQAVIRYLGYFVSMLPLFLGFLWVAFDQRKRGFHDMLAGSVVVVRHNVVLMNDESQKPLDQLIKEAS